MLIIESESELGENTLVKTKMKKGGIVLDIIKYHKLIKSADTKMISPELALISKTDISSRYHKTEWIADPLRWSKDFRNLEIYTISVIFIGRIFYQSIGDICNFSPTDKLPQSTHFDLYIRDKQLPTIHTGYLYFTQNSSHLQDILAFHPSVFRYMPSFMHQSF